MNTVKLFSLFFAFSLSFIYACNAITAQNQEKQELNAEQAEMMEQVMRDSTLMNHMMDEMIENDQMRMQMMENMMDNMDPEQMMSMCKMMMQNEEMKNMMHEMMMGNGMGMGGMNMNGTEHQETNEKFGDVPQAFQTQLTSVVNVYLEIKDELVNSNFDAVQTSIAELDQTLNRVNSNLLEGNARDIWTEHMQNIHSNLEKMADADDIDAQRVHFKFISDAMAKSASSFGIDGVVYLQYCPMEDANWLSCEEEIANPYMANMQNCGEVIEKID